MPASKKGKLFREEQPIPKELTDKTIFSFDFFSFSHLAEIAFLEILIVIECVYFRPIFLIRLLMTDTLRGSRKKVLLKSE